MFLHTKFYRISPWRFRVLMKIQKTIRNLQIENVRRRLQLEGSIKNYFYLHFQIRLGPRMSLLQKFLKNIQPFKSYAQLKLTREMAIQAKWVQVSREENFRISQSFQVYSIDPVRRFMQNFTLYTMVIFVFNLNKFFGGKFKIIRKMSKIGSCDG